MNDFKQKFKKIILLIGDIALLYLSLFLVLKLRYGNNYNPEVFRQHFYPFTITYIFWLIVFYINNFYALDYARNTYRFYASIIKSFLFNAVISIFFFYITFFSIGISPKTNLLLNVLFFAILFTVWRISYNYFIKTKSFSINTLILNDNEETKELIQKTKENPQLGYTIYKYELNNISNIKKYVAENNIKLVVTSDKLKNNPDLMNEFYELLSTNTNFESLPNFYEQIMGRIPISIIGKVWFLENIKNLDRPLYDIFKKIMDISIATISLLISLPIYPFIILAIKLDSAGPAFIVQKRIGKNNKIFNNIKFRSMTVNDGGIWPGKNDARITKIGRYLRKTRLDELPQLINVILGDISLVGPRPDIIDLYTKLESEIPYYQIRNMAKPGLTGWAQVNQDISPHSIEETKQRLSYDFYYVKNKSLILDIIIILKTIRTLLSRAGS